MYADAYPRAISPDQLERLALAATPCWTGAQRHRAWSCALRAAGDSFCPCVALAAGGADGGREQALLDAIADEIRRCAEREGEVDAPEALPDQPVAAVAGAGRRARSDQSRPRCRALPAVSRAAVPAPLA